MARTRTIDGTKAQEAQEAGSFKPWPDGEYIGEILDVKPVKFARDGANKNMDALNVTFKFIESGTGKGVGKKFIAWQVPDEPEFASGSTAWLHYQFYKAVGVEFPKEGEKGEVEYPDLEDLLGQEVGFELRTEKDLKDNLRNRVQKFFPASNGVKDTSSDTPSGNGDLDTNTALTL